MHAEDWAGMRFSTVALDRCADERKNGELVLRALQDPNTRFVLLHKQRVLVTQALQANSAILHSSADVRQWVHVEATREGGQTALEPVLLGRLHGRDGAYVFAVDVSQRDETEIAGKKQEYQFFSGRKLLPSELSDVDVSIAGYALARMQWHSNARFCGKTGAPTTAAEGGSKRILGEGSRMKLYPRTDPVVIMLVFSPDGERVLLGRGKSHPKNMYTALAGFVDQCESLEAAVRREVLEEVGVQVGAVQLLGSQPWPIGRAGSCELMIGAWARAETDTLTVDPSELEDARWFEFDEVRSMVTRAQALSARPGAESDALHVPGPYAIAHHLIKAFAEGKQDHLIPGAPVRSMARRNMRVHARTLRSAPPFAAAVTAAAIAAAFCFAVTRPERKWF